MRNAATYQIVGGLFILFGLWVLYTYAFDFNLIWAQIQHNFSQKLPEDYTKFDVQKFQNLLFFYFAILSLALGCLFVCKSKTVKSFFKNIQKAVEKSFLFLSQLKPRYKIWLSILILSNIVFKAYLVFNMPVFFDEAWTYWVFTQKGFLTSLSFYPAPNNHILHSLLTNLSILLPLNKLISLRLPNFIINIFDVILFFIVFSKLFNQKTALFLTALFSFSFPVFYYGYVARGYMIYLGAFLVLFYLAIRILQKKEFTHFEGSLWFAGSLIGFWAIPAFLYPVVTLVIFISIYLFKQKKYNTFKKFMLTNLAVAIGVLLLYLPVFMVSGYKAITENPYVSAWTRISVLRNFDENFETTSWFLFSLPLYITALVLLALIYFFYKQNWTITVQLSFFIILFSPILMLIHSVVPMPRIWIYWLIPVLYLLGILFQNYLQPKLSEKKLIISGLLIVSLEILVFFIRIKNYESDSFYAKDLTAYLTKHTPKKLYLGKNTYLGTSVLFNFQNKGKNLPYQEFFTDLKEDNLYEFDYFLLRKKLDSTLCKKYRLTPVKVSSIKQNVHFLYTKTAQND